MSQGLPVIYTAGEGFDGQFQDGDVGYAVDPHSPQQIAELIEKITLDYNRISRNCLSRVDRFRWDTISDRYQKLYEEIL